MLVKSAEGRPYLHVLWLYIQIYSDREAVTQDVVNTFNLVPMTDIGKKIFFII